jgi:hypothetical protein
MTLVRGTQMSDMVPTVSGGMVEFWSIHPDLPAGLLFDNGTVSGTPTVNMTTSMFTVYANNTGGSASHTINLTILEPSGDLSYTNITLTRTQLQQRCDFRNPTGQLVHLHVHGLCQ